MWLIGILVVLVILLLFWGIAVQRNLVSLDERCKNALSQITVQQNSRWDALGAVFDLVKSYDAHEHQTMMDIIGQRKALSRDSSPGEISNQEGLLSQVMGRIVALSEAYPELKSQAVYQQAMDKVHQYEDHVRKSRMVYNDTITLRNRQVRSFPTSLVAALLHFSVGDYLAETPEKADMPSLHR